MIAAVNSQPPPITKSPQTPDYDNNDDDDEEPNDGGGRHRLTDERLQDFHHRLMAEATSTTGDDDDDPSGGAAVVEATIDDDESRRQKLVAKLNYQVRVEEEVKQALRPYYSKKRISKDEYKSIMSKTVPKICKNKGQINQRKIQAFVYVCATSDDKVEEMRERHFIIFLSLFREQNKCVLWQ